MSNSYLTLEIKKFYNKTPSENSEENSIMVNDTIAYPLKFLMNQNEIISVEFEYDSENCILAKGNLDACKLKITGLITRTLDTNPFCMHLLRRWSKQKISMIDNQLYNANDAFYKEVIATCYHATTENENEIIRKIIFDNAYLCKYTEYENNSQAIFELIVKQKMEYRTNINILPFRSPVILNEDENTFLNDETVTEDTSILDKTRYVVSNRLSIYQSPTISSKTMLDIKKGDEIKIISTKRVDADEYNWVYVECNGIKGWIQSNFLTPFKPATQSKNSWTYTYIDKDGNQVSKIWKISNEEFIDTQALSQEDVTRICKEHNPELVTRGFDVAIYKTSVQLGLNPKVMLATLQQEQGWCKSGKYDKAFGVGTGGNPQSLEDGGVVKAAKIYLRLFNEGKGKEQNEILPPIFINYDSPPYRETAAVFGSKTKEWQNNHQSYVKYMEDGQNIVPVNAVMYAKLRYTPWVDFPPQNSHPLDDWHKGYQSIK